MEQNLLNWQDFDKLHVIRRFRQLVGKWWQVQINFCDAKGFVLGVPKGQFFSPALGVCQRITKEQGGFKGCMGTVKNTSFAAKDAFAAKHGLCHAGFSTISVPLRFQDKYLGCVFADGFIMHESEKVQKEKIQNYLQKLFPNDKNLLLEVEKLPVLTAKEVEYLTELIEMVVEEIIDSKSHLFATKNELNSLKNTLGLRYSFSQMTGKSQIMQNLYTLCERVADSSALILIQGENGTGKELIAKALHYNSKRKEKNFLVVNCGAFNDNVLESELFGHVKGAFTNAVKDRTGFFEAAADGTLFLDEIGDTSLAMQVKLLRVLQEGTFSPLGSSEVRKSKARIICATNKNLEEMIKNGQFREDLYYRLNVIQISVPPLRERKEDIPLLIEHFLNKKAKEGQGAKKNLTVACLAKLLDYDWPGNVRELENEIERIFVLSGNALEIDKEYLSLRIGKSYVEPTLVHGNLKLKVAIEKLEKAILAEGLLRNRYNKTKLAKELGISRANLIAKVARYKLEDSEEVST